MYNSKYRWVIFFLWEHFESQHTRVLWKLSEASSMTMADFVTLSQLDRLWPIYEKQPLFCNNGSSSLDAFLPLTSPPVLTLFLVLTWFINSFLFSHSILCLNYFGLHRHTLHWLCMSVCVSTNVMDIFHISRDVKNYASYCDVKMLLLHHHCLCLHV